MTKGIHIKTAEEIKIMTEGGKKLSKVKESLRKKVSPGVNAREIEVLATELILEEGGKSSFKMVPGYKWSTCVNINQGIVHGIPKKEVVFKKGDIVSVDVGFYYKGFHTDTSFSLGLEVDEETINFLKAGEKALAEAIDKTKIGNKIYDISKSIESVIESAGYSPVRALVGHGVGRDLHEDPQIPCFADPKHMDNSLRIVEGMVIAIEVMYSKGSGDVALDEDGWTISASDGKITALFEDTIAVTKEGPLILT